MLRAGFRLGKYEILSLLGSGGMGQVYRARDTRLGREVAIKVLPEDVSSDPERCRRFELEARAASALNHPNVVVVHDFASHEGVTYIVSELIDGESLRALIDRKQIGLRRLLEIATQIADGLAAAHSVGLWHRDLKPENVMVARDGRTKILDFGLAKQEAVQAQTAGGSTVTARSTAPGTVLGTAGYMSPEQVKGEPMDHRSDIFSLGIVLFEMAAGRRPFGGGSFAEISAGVLKSDTPELPAGTPAALDQIVRHCLEKEPSRRFQSVQDLAFALRSAGTVTPAPAVEQLEKGLLRKRLRVAIVAAFLLSAGLLAGGYFWGVSRRPASPSFKRLTYQRGTITGARFAPDGRTIVYSARWDGAPGEIFLGRVESSEARSLEIRNAAVFSVSSTGDLALALDAHYYLFEQYYGTLASMPVTGGAPRTLLTNVYGAEWSPDGTNLAVAHSVTGRMRLEYPIGKILYETSGWISSLRFSPDGTKIAFLDHPVPRDNRGGVMVIDLSSNQRVQLPSFSAATGLAWSAATGEILATVTSGGRELHGLTLSGRDRTLLRWPLGMTLHDVRADGSLLLCAVSRRQEVLAMLKGASHERNLTWRDSSVARDVSADGKNVLIQEQNESTGTNYKVYMRRTDGSPAVPLGEGGAWSLSADGNWALASLSGPPSQLVLLPTGAGEPKKLLPGGLQAHRNAVISADGRRVVFTAYQPGHAIRLWVQAVDGGDPEPISPEGILVEGKMLSPDGAWAAARPSPGADLNLYPLSGGAPRPLPGVSKDEHFAGWSSDGKSVFVAGQGLPLKAYRVDIASGKRDLVQEFNPSDLAGLSVASNLLMTSDGRNFMFGFSRLLTDLYMLDRVE